MFNNPFNNREKIVSIPVEELLELMGKGEVKVIKEKEEDVISEFEGLPKKELQEQYETQKEILRKTGILEKLSTGEFGIKAIDNKEYVFPQFSEIMEKIRKNKEIIKTKIEQGLNILLIVPFGMKLADLIEKYKQVILKHYEQGKLLATKEDPSDPDEPLELDKEQPIYCWDKYRNADINGELVYYPKELSENHQGKTKQELLKEQGGWNILLAENLFNIPRKNKGKTIKGRKQFEAGQTPSQYLETLKADPQYRNETGMTPEDQIIYAITHLEQTNQVVDDYLGKGSASYQLGAYFSALGVTPDTYWNRDYQQVVFGKINSMSFALNDGIRDVVRVF